jgi:hypothetical protein
MTEPKKLKSINHQLFNYPQTINLSVHPGTTETMATPTLENLRANFIKQHPEITFREHTYKYHENHIMFGLIFTEVTKTLPFKNNDIHKYTEWLDYIKTYTKCEYKIVPSHIKKDPYYAVEVEEGAFKRWRRRKRKEKNMGKKTLEEEMKEQEKQYLIKSQPKRSSNKNLKK